MLHLANDFITVCLCTQRNRQDGMRANGLSPLPLSSILPTGVIQWPTSRNSMVNNKQHALSDMMPYDFMKIPRILL
jgi:hypothetical protein